MSQTLATKRGRHYANGEAPSGGRPCVGTSKRSWGFLALTLVPVAWLALIAGHTAAYISPIVAVVALAEYGIYKSLRPGSFERRERRLLCVLAALLSFGAALANHAQMSVARGALVVMLGFPVFLVALEVLWQFADAHTIMGCDGRSGQGEALVFLRYFAFLSVAYLAYLFLCNYPAAMSPDSLDQVSQIIAGQYSNHHPFWHTMLIVLVFRPTYAVTGSLAEAVASYSVLQSLMQAAVLALGLSTLERMGQPKRRVLLMALAYACLPQFLTFSSTMWKDVPFALAGLLLVIGCVREQRRVGGERSNLVFIALGLLGTCALRNNGIYVAIAFVPFACVLLARGDRRAPVAITLVATLALGIFMRYPALALLNVQQTDGPCESLSIPIQQIARVSSKGGLSEDEFDELNHFLPAADVPDLYDPSLSDPVKFTIDNEYLNSHLGDFFSLWARVGLEHPKDYVAAWVDQTVGYWYGGYQYWVWFWGIRDNDMGLTWANGPARAFFDCYGALFTSDGILALFVCIGVMDILALLAFAAGAVRGRRDVVLAALPSLLTLLTLLVATPVSCEYRYAYTVAVTLPFLVGLLLCAPRGADSEAGRHGQDDRRRGWPELTGARRRCRGCSRPRTWWPRRR